MVLTPLGTNSSTSPGTGPWTCYADTISDPFHFWRFFMGNLMVFYVGAVLCCNGLWILGHIEDRELAIIDFFVGGLGLFVAGHAAVTGDPWFGAQILLFAFTYLWVALNRYLGVDGRGLGWFCLFVAVSALPWGLILLFQSGGALWPTWLALSWIAWAILWFMFFLLLALQKEIAKITGWVTLLEGIVTGWIPGWLLLVGWMK